MKNLKKTLFITVFCTVYISSQISAQKQNANVYEFREMNQQSYRYYINIPDIEGYETLKCDFHIHTIFSDGQVWPGMRVNEAWNDGLDAIAITDHIEYHPNKSIVNSDLNTSNEMALKQGNEIGMLVIKGTEITRSKPLGHINALFVQDANKIEVANELDAIDEAVKQGAYLIWNHPGWPNDTSTLYPIHKELIAKKKLHGAEVFNSWEYYPKVLDWCNEYGLAYFANTDLHYTSANMYREKFQRPMTLVFVEERSVEGIKEALFDGRTVAYFNKHLAGSEKYIKSLIKKSLSVKVVNLKKNSIEICNTSDLLFQIQFGEYAYSIAIYPREVLRINIPSETEIAFTNCLTGQNKYVKMPLW
ncbi:hypothetical protein SAMN05444274_11185 [Mariniphaga anaerophila]|uniref:Polymerase/histidinol phosphatase N-terminal domain-containing protein n=1 Tax=Mariniphaga anaerophila TaxID=1484053 RepID=A0A1M5FBK1_9BACT|nr:hypothetical protein SAMN05444274_11185 [Mariniphaga anaerophila]